MTKSIPIPLDLITGVINPNPTTRTQSFTSTSTMPIFSTISNMTFVFGPHHYSPNIDRVLNNTLFGRVWRWCVPWSFYWCWSLSCLFPGNSPGRGTGKFSWFGGNVPLQGSPDSNHQSTPTIILVPKFYDNIFIKKKLQIHFLWAQKKGFNERFHVVFFFKIGPWKVIQKRN